MKAIALFLILVFVVGTFAQQPAPPDIIPGTGLRGPMTISDVTLIVRQGRARATQVVLTWETSIKEMEMPLENYTVEIERITDGRGEEIPWPEGLEITTHDKGRPTVKKSPYKTFIYVQIRASIDTPTGLYVVHLISKGYGTLEAAVTVVVIDKEFVYAQCN